MQVLVLGATGRTGKHVLNALLDAGHNVHVLVRDKSKVGSLLNSLLVFEGDVRDKQTLLNAMKDCTAVISVLNIARTSDFPWARLRTPKDFLSVSMTNILEVTKEVPIDRLIVCSAWGVHETKKDIPGWFRWVINNSNVGVAYADHEIQENLVRSSGLNYTIVRPTGLTNSLKEKQVQVTQDNIPKPKLTISRKSTAGFMVELLGDSVYTRQVVTISNK